MANNNTVAVPADLLAAVIKLVEASKELNVIIQDNLGNKHELFTQMGVIADNSMDAFDYLTLLVVVDEVGRIKNERGKDVADEIRESQEAEKAEKAAKALDKKNKKERDALELRIKANGWIKGKTPLKKYPLGTWACVPGEYGETSMNIRVKGGWGDFDQKYDGVYESPGQGWNEFDEEEYWVRLPTNKLCWGENTNEGPSGPHYAAYEVGYTFITRTERGNTYDHGVILCLSFDDEDGYRYFKENIKSYDEAKKIAQNYKNMHLGKKKSKKKDKK